MIKVLFIWVLICGLIHAALSQDYKFQRIIECENNDFQVVEQQNQNELPDAFHNQQTLSHGSSQQNRETQQIQAQRTATSQVQSPKKTVRCKKWIQSYKIIEKNHLRKDQQTQPKIEYQATRKPIEAINHRGLMTITDLSSEEPLVHRRGGGGAAGFSNNYQQQVAQLMSLYFHFMMMSNVIIYQEG